MTSLGASSTTSSSPLKTKTKGKAGETTAAAAAPSFSCSFFSSQLARSLGLLRESCNQQIRLAQALGVPPADLRGVGEEVQRRLETIDQEVQRIAQLLGPLLPDSQSDYVQLDFIREER